MKVSVSLPDEDVEFLDQYVRTQGHGSRSAVVRQAVRRLRASQLDDDFADAWSEWSESGDAESWDAVVGDGLGTG